MRRIFFVILALVGSHATGCGSSGEDEGLFGSGGSGGAPGGKGGTPTGGSSGRSGTGGGLGTAGQATDASAGGTEAAGGAGGDLEGGVGTDSPIEGGLGPTPSSVQCRDQQCDLTQVPPSICCLQIMSLFPTMCSPSFPGCPTPGARSMACDDTSDCRNGERCCATRLAGTYVSSGCAATCSEVRLCRGAQDCEPGQTCAAIPDLPGFFGCR